MKKLLLAISVVAFVFCSPFQISAQSLPANQVVVSANKAPEIYVTDLKINPITGKNITGQFTVFNSEQYYLADLNYEINFLSGSSFNNLQLIDNVVPKGTFFVPPGQKIVKTFSYAFPQNIISGDYTIRLQVITGRGTELGWQDQVVTLVGNNNFLNIIGSSAQVLSGTQQGTPLEGINVLPTDSVTASVQVQNPGDQITVVPQITVFQRQVDMPVVKQYQDSPITFNKNEQKTVNLTMPNLTTPESYLAEVKFLQNNQQVSGTQYFRWVVEGESGKILSLTTDKDYFKAGDSINLTIQTIGPADGSDLGTGQLEVDVLNQDGTSVAKISNDVPINASLNISNISIPVKNELISPLIDVKLIKDGKILDERKINLPVFSAPAKQLQQQLFIQKMLPYLLIVIILIIILAAVFLFRRFKNKKSK